MNTKSGIRGARVKGLLAALVPTIALGGLSAPTYAGLGDAGYFLGGMATTRVLGDMRRRTRAAEVQAASTAQMARERAAPTVVAAPPAAAAPAAGNTASVESKLNTLDTLLAKGYITKQQYDARQKAVLDGI